MHESFISVIGIVESGEDVRHLPEYLRNVNQTLASNFTDYEIIIVNNGPLRHLDEAVNPLPPDVRQHVYLITLSSPVDRNHALVAGLDRANGDYVILFELLFRQKADLLFRLFERSAQGFDMVYLHARRRKTKVKHRLFYQIFYWILRNYSGLSIDDHAHDTRLISRRALNSLLRFRENMRYVKALYSLVGYRADCIEVAEPLPIDPSSFTEKFRTSLVAITSFTSFLRSLLLRVFLLSIAFMAVVVFNAVKVKLTNYDIFGDYHEALSGWTFLVVLMSVFFAITCFMLYVMSIYLANIYQEIKHRPIYIIESVKRY